MTITRSSFQKIVWGSLASLFLFASSCVGFKQATLYDGVETESPPPRPRTIALAVEPVIFEDDLTDVWGLEKTVCKDASQSTDVTYKGSTAIKLNWNRNEPGCEWAGIGIGWDSYAGKDISEILDYAAIELNVRSQEGKMFGLPIVLTFEDYSGGMGFSYTGNKYFERPFIDEEWQKVVVPLNTFDMEVENLDPTNIKQLMLELQQSGGIYLDEIRLVYYEEQPQEPWLVEAPLADPLAMPKQLFDDSFINNNGWGLIADECQNIALTTDQRSQGKQSIHAKWSDPSGTCRHVAFGLSWYKWRPVDITSILTTVALQFDIKTATGTYDQLPVKVTFEDYERKYSQAATLTGNYVKGGQYSTEWSQVSIPVSAFSEGIDLTNVKQLVFKFENTGEVFIDNIQLVSVK